jgi:hypothetical protein
VVITPPQPAVASSGAAEGGAKIAAVNEQIPPHTPRNPLRNEGDMFRVLIMFGVGAAIVIAVALLLGSLAGVIVLAILLAVGLWRTWGLIQDWRRYGSDPEG